MVAGEGSEVDAVAGVLVGMVRRLAVMVVAVVVVGLCLVDRGGDESAGEGAYLTCLALLPLVPMAMWKPSRWVR
ncbi:MULTISPECIES: hypothetical protein [Streptomyces]|uniref:hypothetical protein n=1 Tax=Streptomyces TaxID=1883 RepID=UPI0006999923|nr:hypothetical protein [Streptomyces sp. SID7805]MYU51115.1 hypothetical protein [Streptomyces sp. SID7805]